MPPILQKISINGDISFAYATKDEIYIATSGQTNILQKISVIAGENVAESGEYETLFYRSQEYGKLSKIRIRANCHGKSGGKIEIFARRDVADDWTKLCEFNDKKWIQKREKSFLNDKL